MTMGRDIMDMDVCIPTLNSEKTLKTCLDSVINVMPRSRIIVCDGYSRDGTVKTAKNYGCDVVYSRGRLGRARNVLMKEADTEWFAFIDSDVEINKSWLYGLLRTIDDSVGAVNGFALPDSLVLNLIRKPMLFTKAKLNLGQRGFTSNTLVRKDAVKGVTLPRIGRCEDIILQEKIEGHGWEWKIVPAFCRHLKTSRKLLLEARQDLKTISGMRNMGLLRALMKL